jgi:hypothetical protein
MEKYIVQGFGKSYYCKMTKYNFAFGGKDAYCVFIAIKSPTEVYLDRVETNEACVKNGKLDHRGATAQMVSVALWTLKELLPGLTNIPLIDDSSIECQKGSKLYKLSLSYDYILKYNETWYERNFHARLLEPFHTQYKESLLILDQPVEPIEYFLENIPSMEKYKDMYEGSPRKFIQNLRNDAFCFNVGPWLNRYMELLKISYYKNEWQIFTATLDKPENYARDPTTESLRGTRRRKKTNFRIAPNRDLGHSLGYYDGKIEP